MSTKKCTRCKEEKPKDIINFPPHNKKLDGLDSWCRDCRATYRNEINRGRHRSVISDELLKEIKRDIIECVICGADGPLVVDHCHITGVIRGLLCSRCNSVIGMVEENVAILRKMIDYLIQTAGDLPDDYIDPLIAKSFRD